MPTKTAAKKSTARKRRQSPAPEPSPMPEPMPGPEMTTTRVVYFSGCKGCAHIPFSLNGLLLVLVAVIFTLSAMLMASSVRIDSQAFQIKTFNQASGTTVNTVASR